MTVKTEGSSTTPEIYAAISLLFDKDINIISVVNELNNSGIYDIKIRKPKHDSTTCFDIAVVKNKRFWELNDALSEMFSKVEHCLNELKDVTTKYQGEIYVDIAFYQHGNYPALVIYGQNMKKIRFLKANISIDPF